MSQTTEALSIITNVDTAVKAAQVSLQAGVDTLPGKGAQHLADKCQAALDALAAPAAVISDEVLTLTEEANRGQ